MARHARRSLLCSYCAAKMEAVGLPLLGYYCLLLCVDQLVGLCLVAPLLAGAVRLYYAVGAVLGWC